MDAMMCTLEPMKLADLAEVLAIESASFASPWPPGAFAEELRNANARMIVARGPGGSVAAYLCLWILPGELQINNLAVAPAFRRHGLATRMLAEALRIGAGAGCVTAWLDVRPSNEAALNLYRHHGFEVVQRRRRYYGDTGEDALVMRAALKAPESG